MLAGEHFAGAPEADWTFVENQQCAVLVAGGADFLPIIDWRNEGRATDGLCNHSRDVAFFFEDVLDVISTLKVAGLAAFEGAVAVIGRRHMLAPREQRTDAATEYGFTSNRDRVERCAVKGIPRRNHFESTGGDAGELQSHTDCGGSTRSEENAIKVARRQLGQSARQFDGGDVRVAA